MDDLEGESHCVWSHLLLMGDQKSISEEKAN